jgi:tetratricopeptide (TPR) repeat protein
VLGFCLFYSSKQTERSAQNILIMRKVFSYLLLFFYVFAFAQKEELAQYYYEKGDFEKAQISYQELLSELPYNSMFFLRTIDCYQQLKQFDVAEKALQERLSKYKQANLLVELGYNYQLQKNEFKAKKKYEEALDRIKKNPNDVFTVSTAFERKVLLEYALKSYKIGFELNPSYNFNYQMGLLYGQLGNTDMMITTFLDEAYSNPQNALLIQNQLARFMSDVGDSNFSDSLRKALILRGQKNQDIFWNRYLSWFYIQQKEFEKAFIQEKAIYKRNPESLSNILNLGELVIEEDNQEVAVSIFGFVIANTKDTEVLIQANSYLLKMEIDKAQDKDLAQIQSKIQDLMNSYGVNPISLPLQLIQAHFVAFRLNKPQEARVIVKKTLELTLTEFQTAQAKMELADIFLFEEKYNQALLYYSQIEMDVKNDVVAQEASLMSARTSYFKTDFVWALQQFKALKSANTQLIANDALEYFLLINDNTVADSTQTALKQFAKGDYLLYQNRTPAALEQFKMVLKNFKGQEIEALTFLRLGKIYEKIADFSLALIQYKEIVEQHSDGIYVDEALFFSAEIYNKKLNDPEKAKALYEKIIFNHQDSIYFVTARKKFRELRGDANL